MKVSKCENCIFCERKTYTSTYKPTGYHVIGVTHAYRYCEKYEKRCSDIKEKDCLAFCEKSEDLSEIIEANNLECAKRIYEIQQKLKEGDTNE